MLIEPAFLSVSFPLLRPNFHWWNRCCPPFFQKVYHIDLTGSAWLPLVTAVQNGLPLSLNEFVRCLSKVPARPIGVYNLLGVVYLSFDWCWPPCNCSCFLAGWLLLPSNQDGFYYEYLSLLSEIGLPFIGPASPCFPCRYHCSIKMNNDATPT